MPRRPRRSRRPQTQKRERRGKRRGPPKMSQDQNPVHPKNESKSKPGTRMVHPDSCFKNYLWRRSAAILGRGDRFLLTFNPGFDCGSNASQGWSLDFCWPYFLFSFETKRVPSTKFGGLRRGPPRIGVFLLVFLDSSTMMRTCDMWFTSFQQPIPIKYLGDSHGFRGSMRSCPSYRNG